MATKPDCYDYVRNYYHVPAHAGGRVAMGERRGTIARKAGSQQYVYVTFDGSAFSLPVHPTDLVYEAEPK